MYNPYLCNWHIFHLLAGHNSEKQFKKVKRDFGFFAKTRFSCLGRLFQGILEPFIIRKDWR